MSTLEAEYLALSESLKVLLPIKRLVQELVKSVESPELKDVSVHASVFEDNQGAYYLATNQRITNRTKYFLVRWHWFWEHYRAKEFSVNKCPTEDQLADYFTKSLPRETFERNRNSLQGW